MTTSDDRAVELLYGILQVCRESAEGYATAERNVPDAKIWRELEPYRKQRAKMIGDIEQRLRDLRGDPDIPPSQLGALHRAVIEVRSVADSDPNAAVLAEVERGEAVATAAYRQALKEHDIDSVTHQLLEKQYELVQAAHDRVRQLLDRLAPTQA